MAKYGYDKENAEFLPQRIVEELRIIAHDTELGQYFSDYMVETVSKIFLAKNKSLLQDKDKKLADEIRVRQTQDNEKEKLDEHYLESHIIEKEGSPITDIESMREYVRNNFYFVISDEDNENAWIMPKGDKKVVNVNRKMLEFAQTSAQIEGVIAHELGHFFVNEIYENASNGNINETLADKHAIDCLYYMGKNPAEYCDVFIRFNDIQNMTEIDAILAGVEDEHGSPSSRLQAMEDYMELAYGDAILELEKNEAQQSKNQQEDEEFIRVKENIEKLHERSEYIGYFENKFIEDAEFAPYLNSTKDKLDISRVPFEKVIDKLLELSNDENFTYISRIQDCAYLLANSSKDGVELTPELQEKASKLLTIASDYVIINSPSISNKNQTNLEYEINRQMKYISEYYNKYPGKNLVFDLYKEAKENGEEVTANVLAEKLEGVLKEQNIVLQDSRSAQYKGKEVALGYEEIKLLSLVRPNSPYLSEEVKRNRFQYFKYIHLSSAEKVKHRSAVDDLAFALAYPNLNLNEHKKELAQYRSDKETSECEKAFYAKIISTPHLTLSLPYAFQEEQEAIERAKNGNVNTIKIPKYSKFAFDLPGYTMPSKEKAIGSTVEWSTLLADNKTRAFHLSAMSSLGLTKDDNVEDALCKLGDIRVNKEDYTKVVSLVKFEDEEYDFVTDNSGKIIAIDEEAKALRQEKSDTYKARKQQEISNNFETQLNMLNAIYTIKELTSKERTPQEEELLKETTDYIINYPSVEQYLYLTKTFGLGTFNNLKKELSYIYMPLDEEQINKDFEKLQQSQLYKDYFDDKQENLTAEEKSHKIHEFMSLNAQENTAKMLAAISPTMISLARDLQEKNENEHIGSYIEGLADTIWESTADITGQERENIKQVCLAIYNVGVKEVEGIIGSKDNFHAATIYVNKKIPYYETCRAKLGLKETDKNPEQLYANLQETINDKNYRNGDYNGLPKVLLGWKQYIFAEYEVLRYLNNPENPPVDIKKLLESYPKITDVHTSSKEFCNYISNYILNHGFKDLSIYEQKEIYDLMSHKSLFDSESEIKFEFLEQLKQSYLKLPEEEKENAAIMMLQDKKIPYKQYDKFLRVKITDKVDIVNSVDYRPIREFFEEEYANIYTSRIGKEPILGNTKSDGTSVTNEDIVSYHNNIISFMNRTNQTMCDTVKNELFALVANKIEAQQDLSEKFAISIKHQEDDNDLGFKNEASARVISSLNQYLIACPNSNLDVINFLTEPCTQESINNFKKNLHTNLCDIYPLIMSHQSGEAPVPMTQEEKDDFKENINEISNEDLKIFHSEFRGKSIEEGAVVMQRLLGNYSKNNVNKAVEVVLDKFMEKDDPYYQDANNILCSLYARGLGSGYYRKDQARFMLGAMLAAKKPTEDGQSVNMSIGEALAKFCSNNGPAWVKFGQALSNIPNLPDDIRKPLSVLKDRATILNRWEIYEELKENLPEEKLKSIKRVGKVLGAGSFYISVEVEDQEGQKSVLQMMRQNAAKDAYNEFKKIGRTIEELSKKDNKYSVLKTIVARAEESAKTEIDIAMGYAQYVEAYKNYNMVDKLEVDGVKFNLSLCPWKDWSYNKETGSGYKEMEFGDGKSLAKIDCTPEEKKILAIGYLTTELGILLSGRAWDIDRHAGQQNFNVNRDENGKITSVDVNIFDTGALRKAPSEEDKLSSAHFYAEVIKSVINGEKINDVMFREVEKLEKQGKDASYISDIQRGCIALADICEYQKEEKDSNGKVIKESKSLTANDFVQIISSIANSGMLDHTISDNVLSGILKDKKFLAKLAINQIKKKVSNIGTSKKEEETVKVTFQAKPITQQKEENKKIDESLQFSEDNPFKTKEIEKLSKKERKEKIDKERKGNKLSRNLQAMYLKMCRKHM